MAVDPAKLEALVGRMAAGRGAVADSVPVPVGDKLGLSKAPAAVCAFGP